MIGAVLSIFSNRWFRFAVAAVAGMVIVFGAGYLKGYGTADAKAQRQLAQALEEQQERLLSMADSDRRAAIAQVKREQKTRTVFRDIKVPVDADCDSPEWLQSYNAAVRAANSRGTATGSASDARSGWNW